MQRNKTIAAGGAAVVVVAGGLLLPAVASGSTTSHTLKFTAVTQRQANFSKTSFGEDEVDLQHGKVIGFDVINGTLDPMTHTATGRVALSTRGGLLYGKLRFSNGPITHGTVTGGTGRFKGATGTILGKSLNKSGTRTAVVVHWSN